MLRESFAGVLPDVIRWRQREQLSDGVGYGWIDGLRAHAERQVGDEAFAAAATGFPVNPPQTKEAYWYRSLFEEAFPGEACARTVPGGRSIACSSPVARSEEHTSELQSLLRLSSAVFCLKKKNDNA